MAVTAKLEKCQIINIILLFNTTLAKGQGHMLDFIRHTEYIKCLNSFLTHQPTHLGGGTYSCDLYIKDDPGKLSSTIFSFRCRPIGLAEITNPSQTFDIFLLDDQRFCQRFGCVMLVAV